MIAFKIERKTFIKMLQVLKHKYVAVKYFSDTKKTPEAYIQDEYLTLRLPIEK